MPIVSVVASRASVGLGGVALLLALGGCDVVANEAPAPAPAVSASAAAPASAPAPTPDGPEIPADAERMVVTYVYDGDTIYLQPAAGDELKVRLIGVDTPELRPSVECFGAEATEWLRGELPEGLTVWAASDAEPLDRYGRSLLYVWLDDGTLVNLELVAQGYAESLRVGENDAWYPELVAAEELARQQSLGRWGAC